MSESKAVLAGLLAVQQALKAPKDKSSNGRYQYRSAEDILERVKPLLQENGLVLMLDEEIKADAVGSFILSTATLIDIASGTSISTHSMAREDVGTKLMSPGQATGAAISYARKYTLGGLFLIDNEQDLDSPDYQAKIKGKPPAQSNNGQDEMKQKSLKGLAEKTKELGILPSEVTNIIQKRYGKGSSKELTAGEAADLANNIQRYLEEAMGQPIGVGA